MKLSLAAVCCFSTIFGVKAWIDQERYITHTDTQKKEFRSLEYQQQMITTPREAYTVLIDWADCDVEMREKSDEEIQEILPVLSKTKPSESCHLSHCSSDIKPEYHHIFRAL